MVASSHGVFKRLFDALADLLARHCRVLTVVARGETIARAREKVYANIARIHFDGCHYRRDIALIEET